MVMRSLGPTYPGDLVPGEAVQSHGSLSEVDPLVAKLGLLGCPGVQLQAVS
jgi:hypothetical protein